MFYVYVDGKLDAYRSRLLAIAAHPHPLSIVCGSWIGDPALFGAVNSAVERLFSLEKTTTTTGVG